MDNISSILKTLRLKSSLSQADLAKLLGVSRSAVSSYENGTRSPNNETLVKLATIFNVSTDFILGHPHLSDSSDELAEFFFQIKNLLDTSDLSNDNKTQVLADIKEYFQWRLNNADPK